MTTDSPKNSKAGLLVNDKYRLTRKVGSGSFGEIYFAVHVKNKKAEPVAIKLESARSKHAQILSEGELYQSLSDGTGIPRIIWYGQTGSYNALVMQYLGPSLEDLFSYCSRRFSLQTTLMLADQMIDRIQFVHSKCIIHRDIKPNNFLIGNGSNLNRVYIIDFGLAKLYKNPVTDKHIPYRGDKGLTGTARYASIRNHMGKEQSRRDDLETLGYVLIYFLRGRLPWQGLKVTDRQAKYDKICQMKMDTPIEELCKGCPEQFRLYMRYCRNLKFEQTPDYSYLRSIFQELYHNMNFQLDTPFDWNIPPAAASNNNSRLAKRSVHC